MSVNLPVMNMSRNTTHKLIEVSLGPSRSLLNNRLSDWQKTAIAAWVLAVVVPLHKLTAPTTIHK